MRGARATWMSARSAPMRMLVKKRFILWKHRDREGSLPIKNPAVENHEVDMLILTRIDFF